MPRVQTNYQGGGQQLQSVATPMLQAIQAKFDPNDSGAFQLAKQLGALDVNGLASQVYGIQNTQDAMDRKAAEQYANSRSMDDLRKEIGDGKLLPSQSPAFNAALQHIYGENAQSTFERDTLSKLQTGELKFNSQEEADAYLTKGRNDTLTGQSKYAITGYDKGYGAFRDKVFSTNATVVNKAAVDRGVQEASDNLSNVLLQVSDPMYKGDKQEAAGVIVARYQLLRKTSLLRDDAAKEALTGVFANISTSGDKELAAALLDKKLDNGLTVRSVMGDLKAAQFQQHTETMFDKNQRQRIDTEIRPFVFQADKGELDRKAFDDYVAKNEKYLTTSTIHAIVKGNDHALQMQQALLAKGQALAAAEQSRQEANTLVATAAAQGNLPFLKQLKVLTPNGEATDLNMEDAGVAAIQDQIARNPQMPVGKQTELWSTNGVKNPEWEKQIKGGVSNLASVGWNFDGKNIGELNQQGQAAIDTFMRINKTNPGYAEKLTGSSKDYQMMSDIQFLMERGNMSMSDAASRVNQGNRTGIGKEDYGSLQKKVQSAVGAVVDPHWYSGTASWISGLFGNDQTNLTAIKSDLTRMTELLVKTGMVPDADAAVQESAKYLANPAITTKINNTLYFNKDLPTVPAGEDPGKWMERFIKEVPGVAAASNNISPKNVRLEPDQNGGFVAWTGGVPLTDARGNVVNYRKDQISLWIDGARTGDMHRAQDDANFTNYRKRIEGDMFKAQGKDALPGTGQASIAASLGMIGSRDFFDKMSIAGNTNKSVKELQALYKEYLKKK